MSICELIANSKIHVQQIASRSRGVQPKIQKWIGESESDPDHMGECGKIDKQNAADGCPISHRQATVDQ